MCSINHEKKAIFIHIPKTAGSYLAEVLQKNYGFKNYYLQRPDHKQFCFQKYIDNSVKYHENKIHGTIVYYKTSKYLKTKEDVSNRINILKKDELNDNFNSIQTSFVYKCQ